jgi:hypothetical protein
MRSKINEMIINIGLVRMQEMVVAYLKARSWKNIYPLGKRAVIMV